MIGKTISHYHVVDKIGEGGMGEVFLADDISLGRRVALKFLPPEMQKDDIAHKRFLREARSAAALNHPYICSIHEVSEVGGKDFIVMEYVEGQTLKERLAKGPFTIREALQVAAEIAEALEQAHDKGIIHRDLKPANIMLAQRGHVKVMDFGLAKQVKEAEKAVSQEDTLTALTREGSTLGTLAYMSPQQLRGEAVDARSDIFSFGIVLYEILTGVHPFRQASPMDTAAGIINKEPTPLSHRLEKIPELLQQTVSRMLAKDVGGRYSDIHEVRADLGLLIRQFDQAESGIESGNVRGIWRLLAKPALVIPGLVVIVVLGYLASTAIYQNRKVRWASQVALPEIKRLISKDDYSAAFRVAIDAEKYIARDPQLIDLFSDTSRLLSIRTSPPGGLVYIKEYGDSSNNWQFLGQTPLESVRISLGFKQYKIVKDGFDELTGFTGSDDKARGAIQLERTLERIGSITPDMVKVDGGDYQPTIISGLTAAKLESFQIDRFEVTNKKYQAFVDSGGYRDRKYWKQEFVKAGQRLTWEDAISEFADKTGRPGPATWQLAHYPEGQDDYPVGGISWYEAAAYAEFVGKSLPTVHHWNKAAGMEMRNTHPVILHSNFSDSGPASVGKFQGLSPYGAFDMAGNVREWCWNGAGGDKRCLCGGSWGVPQYMASSVEKLPPFDRDERNGFRCMRSLGQGPLSESTKISIPPAKPVLDLTQIKPVSDEVFKVYYGSYLYDKTPLDPKIETTEDIWIHCVRQTVTFNAAYGGERVIAYLYIPKGGKPPYQTVIYFPGSAALTLSSIDGYNTKSVEIFTRAGRAAVFPVYKGTFQRPRVDASTPTLTRDRNVMLYKDLGRTIDYLETRPEFDTSKLAYYGLSWGAALGPIHGALEKRLKAFILTGAGIPRQRAALPENDFLNFAPRMTAPVLILNGRYDLNFPETSAKPYLDCFGTPQKDKRIIFYGSGHLPPLGSDVIKEMLDWLDRYLGPVR
jgi:serine/threonine protein kinase/formylglycine-generating enzyme required for sulfatase activity/dienelactone hydrolase